MGLLDFFKGKKEKTEEKKAPETTPKTPANQAKAQAQQPAATKPATPTTEPPKSQAQQPSAPKEATPATGQAKSQTTATPQFDSYTVKEGDSLSLIAKNYYGDTQKWNTIFNANKDKIKNPNLIKPGMVLKVPKNQ